MTTELLAAGFGGQGVMLLGTLVSYAGMLEGRKVSWMPSYGPEQRGGTANCSVVISDHPIGSPLVTEPDILVVMNLPSLVKFEGAVKAGGLILVNSSLVTRRVERQDVREHLIAATKIAEELGDQRMANMVIGGALLGLSEIVRLESAIQALARVFPERKHNLLPANEQALRTGFDFVRRASA